MKKLLILLFLTSASFAQTNVVGPALAAYINVSGAWTAATSSFNMLGIDNAPAVELYCFNATLNKWVPWTSDCGGGGALTPSSVAATGNISAAGSISAATGTIGGSAICTVAAPCTTTPTLASLGHFHGSVTLTASSSASVGVPGFTPTANGHCVISGENTNGAIAVSNTLNIGYGTNTLVLTFTAPAVAGAKVAFMCDN